MNQNQWTNLPLVLTVDFTCGALFGRGDEAVCHWQNICCFLVTSIHPSFIIKNMKFGSFLICSWKSVWSSFCFNVERRNINFADISLTCKYSVRILWHAPVDNPRSSATNLIVRHNSAHIISCKHAMVWSMWRCTVCFWSASASTFEMEILLKCLKSTQTGLSKS